MNLRKHLKLAVRAPRDREPSKPFLVIVIRSTTFAVKKPEKCRHVSPFVVYAGIHSTCSSLQRRNRPFFDSKLSSYFPRVYSFKLPAKIGLRSVVARQNARSESGWTNST